MRIAVVSIMFKTTPPSGYGGIERVVYYLVEALIKGGHEVILFATPGSYCSNQTVEVPGYDPAIAPSGGKKADTVSEEPLYKAMCAYLQKHPVDIIHDWSFKNLYVKRHPDKFPFLISTCIPPPPGCKRRKNLVASSRAHANLCGGDTKYVYYGLKLSDYQFHFQKKDHFIHISKIARYKGQHLAILAAVKARKRLSIAGNVEDKMYYYFVIKPFATCFPGVEYLGEIEGTNQHLMEATALVQTPRWFDAFPLVTLESFASGTPVIAFAQGGIPEQIVNGVNGYLCRNIGELASAMANISAIRPETCREYAEEYFGAERMAQDYVALYERILDGESW